METTGSSQEQMQNPGKPRGGCLNQGPLLGSFFGSGQRIGGPAASWSLISGLRKGSSLKGLRTFGFEGPKTLLPNPKPTPKP